MSKKTQTPLFPSLSEIRSAMAEIDDKRESESLSKEERDILELSSVALRDSERLIIAKLQNSVIKEMETATEQLSALSKEIRAKVKKMNKVPGTIDRVEEAIKVAVRIIGAVLKWLK